MFPRVRTLAGRMILLLVLGGGGVLVALSGYNYYSSLKIFREELRLRAQATVKGAANRVESVVRSVEKVTEELALALRILSPDAALRHALLAATLRDQPEIFSITAALEGSDGAVALLQAGRRAPGTFVRPRDPRSYPYATLDWFTLPRDLGRPAWSEPFSSAEGGAPDDSPEERRQLRASYAVPLFLGPGPSEGFFGVVACDVSLAWLSAYLASLPLDGGYAFLLSGNGTFITHPNQTYIMQETIFSVAEAFDDAPLRQLGQRMVRGETGFAALHNPSTTKDYWIGFSPVPATGWSLGVLYPQDSLLEALGKWSRQELTLGALGLLLLAALVVMVCRSVTSPLRELDTAVQRLSADNLHAPLPSVEGVDEVARLGRSFAIMVRDLRAHMAELQAATAARERIESDLRIAHEIQMSLVPRIFPPVRGLEIAALLDPAREVGGDFYDAFPLDQDLWAFAVGDVSGKGVPAALFMAVTRTLLRGLAPTERAPGLLMARLNDELAAENDTCMFVTLFYGVVRPSTGELRYASAGHPLPLRLAPGEPVRPLPRVSGPLAGPLGGMTFQEGSATLASGEALLGYTDGVTEALDPEGTLYGEERLVAFLEAHRALEPKELMEALRRELRCFAQEAPQSDDITLMILRKSATADS
ncbi:MAG TPA: SpoIIE family protein phosphatase [Synergistaceae bacterium]|nr:SpoIIE family protein phosphatase [Synergistaceae bacterium]HQF91026.1 SpoIIE family protein phosphatase [Synergistaceae bacterium]